MCNTSHVREQRWTKVHAGADHARGPRARPSAAV